MIACDKKQTNCRSCAATEINNRPGLRDDFVARYATKGENTGSKNGFYGLSHRSETIEKLKSVDRSYTKTPAFRAKMSQVVSRGKESAMYGKTTYQIWVEKHGETKAKELDLIRRQKWSEASSGSKNPMYGKPSPQGSGNGWSGWYKNWYFRSLMELTYVVDFLEPQNLRWTSAESAGVKIKYRSWKGSERTYVPDFLVDNIRLVEIKPNRLINTPTVLLKSQAAKVYCEQIGWLYEILDPGMLADDALFDLRRTESIKFTDRYEKQFQERYNCFRKSDFRLDETS